MDDPSNQITANDYSAPSAHHTNNDYSLPFNQHFNSHDYGHTHEQHQFAHHHQHFASGYNIHQNPMFDNPISPQFVESIYPGYYTRIERLQEQLILNNQISPQFVRSDSWPDYWVIARTPQEELIYQTHARRFSKIIVLIGCFFLIFVVCFVVFNTSFFSSP